MVKSIASILFLFAVVLVVPEAQAALSPVAISVVPPVQFPPSDFNITGVRASLLWGRHRDVYGLDVGLLGNITEQDFWGVGIAGGFNRNMGHTHAILQLAGGANINTDKVHIFGVQAAIGLNLNTAESTVGGVQIALVNLADHTAIYGVQVGLYNVAQDIHGLQIGLVNVTSNLHGVQIGLLNFNHTGLFVVSPILNIGF